MAEPPAHLSPSGWASWDKCPQAWAAHYIDGITEPASAAMEVGIFAHLDLQHLLNMPKQDRTVRAAHAIATEVWHSFTATSIERGEITEREFKRQAWSAVTGLWEIQDPATMDVLATEQEINWREGDVPMKVVIDLVTWEAQGAGLNPGMVVNDHKTGKVPKPRHQGTHKRQITIGAMAVASREGPLAVAGAGALLYVGAEQPVTITAPTDRKARAAVSGAAQQVWADINAACASEEFPATTSTLCQWCSHVADCPEGQSYISALQANGWRNYNPDAPGSRVVAALDAA